MLDASLLPLHDTRVRLRPLARGDAAAYAAGTSDPAVRQYGHLPEPEYTAESVCAMIDRDVRPGLQRGDLAVLAVADITTDAFLGSVVVFDVHPDRAEVGFWIHPEHRGAGLTAAALELAAEFARRSGLSVLTARTVPANRASRRVLEAAGFDLGQRAMGTAPSGECAELLAYRLPLVGQR